MQQLVLKFLPNATPSLDNFLAGPNQMAVSTLTDWLRCQREVANSPCCFYLCGLAGTGKSHLLKASGFRYFDAADDPDLQQLPALDQSETPLAQTAQADQENQATQAVQAAEAAQAHFLAVDHVTQLSAQGQLRLFNAFNHILHQRGKLLVADRAPPIDAVLREDLRTRLGSGLIFQIYPLDDAALEQLIMQFAESRGLILKDNILKYLLTHTPRNANNLCKLLTALEDSTLIQQRPVTLPLLREVLSSIPPEP